MQNFLVRIFGKLWSTLFMSIIPLIELKGGIIYARSVGYGFFTAYGLSYLGSTIAFFPVFLLFIPILNLLKKIKFVNSFAIKIEDYISKRASDALNKQSGKNKTQSTEKIKFITVLIFVAIPLPFTGVWTGTAIAVFMNMKFKDSLIAVAVGNLIAGLIISLLGELCILLWSIESLNIVLWILLGIAVIIFIITVIKIFSKKKAV